MIYVDRRVERASKKLEASITRAAKISGLPENVIRTRADAYGETFMMLPPAERKLIQDDQKRLSRWLSYFSFALLIARKLRAVWPIRVYDFLRRVIWADSERILNEDNIILKNEDVHE